LTIDAHHHLWEYNDRDYVWVTGAMTALRRSFLVPDLQEVMRESGVDLTVAVQARQMTEETEWLLNLARQALHILLLMICVGAGAMPQANPPAAADAQAHVGMGYEFEKDDRFSSAAE